MNVWLQSVLYSCHLYRGFILDIQQLVNKIILLIIHSLVYVFSRNKCLSTLALYQGIL